MKVAIGADHRGFALKKAIVRFLHRRGYEIMDQGVDAPEPADYPDLAFKVARDVAARKARFGILICYTGQGMTMAANKVPGIRAALCASAKIARMARAHNNANVLVIAGSLTYSSRIRNIIDAFLFTPFEGGRHARRVRKITRYESRRKR